MKISTKGRYALRLMLDLALNNTGEYITVKSIAKRQELSEKYLEQIVAVLNKTGLVKSVRGAQGGYRLTRDPKDYKIGDILRATEGDLAPTTCLMAGNECTKKTVCKTYSFWKGLDDVINEYIDSKTLEDLIK